jgi:hypothetical protein
MNGLVDWLGGWRILPIGVPQRKHHAKNGGKRPGKCSTTLRVRPRSVFEQTCAQHSRTVVMTGRAELNGG